MTEFEKLEQKLTKMQSSEGQRLRALADKAAVEYEKKVYEMKVAHAIFVYNEYNFIKFIDKLDDKQLNEYEDALRLLRDAGKIKD